MTPIPPAVVDAARAAQANWRVPASVTVAQWMLESDWGKDEPTGSNNGFGIKAVGDQPFVSVFTKEFVAGRFVTVTARFAKYDSLADAFDAHAQLIATHLIYADAMARLPDVNAFTLAMAAHYATDPNYGQKLLRLMREENLYPLNAAVMQAPADPPVAQPTVEQPTMADIPAPGAAAAPTAIADIDILKPLIVQAVQEATSGPVTVSALMTDTKPIWSSKTFWGLVVAGVATAAQQLGYTLTTGDQSDFINYATNLVTAAALIFAMYGRIVATKAVK
jgi:hypothetical protein